MHMKQKWDNLSFRLWLFLLLLLLLSFGVGESFVQKTQKTMPKSRALWYLLLLLLCLCICVCFDRYLFIKLASSKNIGSFLTWVSVMGQMCPRCGSFNIQFTDASHYMIPKGCENIFLSLPKHPQLRIGKDQLEKYYLFKVYRGLSPSPMPPWAPHCFTALLSSTPPSPLTPSHSLGLSTFPQPWIFWCQGTEAT